MRKKRILAVIMILAMTLAFFTGCGSSNGEESSGDEKELTKITISEFRNISWVAAYIAEENGYFEEEGLDAEFALYDDGPIAFQGMHGGDSQFCLLSQEPVLKAQEEGLKSKLIYCVLDTRLYGFVTSPDIESVVDLKGKAIFAGMQGSAPYSFVSSILREGGLDPEKDVTFVNMDYGASMAALENGQIQGSYINVDNRVEVSQMDVNILVDTVRPEDAEKYLKSEVFPSEIICTTEKFAEENPETVQAFVNAVSKATEWMDEHSGEEIAEVLAPYYEGTEQSVLAEKMDILKESITQTGYIGEEEEMAVEEFCMGNGVITEQIPYEDIVDMTFVNNYQEAD